MDAVVIHGTQKMFNFHDENGLTSLLPHRPRRNNLRPR
jgi:hypothetical protein